MVGAALIGMFAGLFYSIILILAFYAFSAFVPPTVFFISVIMLLLLLNVLIYKWLVTVGVKKFMALK